MARGEPPGQTRTQLSGENAVIEWMKSYLRGMAGGLGSAADPSANMAAQSSAFIPQQQLSAGGRVNSGLARDAINRRAIEQYDPQMMKAGAGVAGVGLAASMLRRPGAAIGAGLRQAAKTTQPSPQEMVQAALAQQRGRGRQVIPPARPPRPDKIKTEGPELTPKFTRAPQGPRDMPKPPEPVPVDTRTTTADGGVNVDNVIKNALKKENSKGLTKKDVSTSWDGKSDPTNQAARFRKIDPETGKSVFWKDGHNSAKNSWRTAQKKSDPRNPNATASRVQNVEADMTPEELQRLQFNRMLDENPQIRAQLDEAEYEAYVRGGGMEFDEISRMMREMPLGNRPSRFNRGKVPPRMKSPARGAEPVKRADETNAQFQKRYDDWAAARTNQTFRLSGKKQKNIKRPVKGIRKDGKPYKNGETEAAYQKRLDKWRAATGPQSRMATTEAERARTGQRLRDAQNVADMEEGRFQPNVLADQRNPGTPGRQPDGGVSRRPGDPEVYQDPRGFRPSDMGPDDFTFYPRFLYDDFDSVADPRTIDLGRSYSAATSQRFGGPGTGRSGPTPLPDLPQFTPTRGPGSTRLRNVRKQAEESPQSKLTDKPAAPKTEPKKSKSKKSETKKNETQQETAPQEEVPIPKRDSPKTQKKSQKKNNKGSKRAALPDYASGRTNDAARKRTFGPARPKSQDAKPEKQSENVRGGGEKPRKTFTGYDPAAAREAARAARANQTARGRKPGSGDPGDAEEARLKGMTFATAEAAKKNRAATPDAPEAPKPPEMPRLSFNGYQKVALGIAALFGGGKAVYDLTNSEAEEVIEEAVEAAVEAPKTKKAQTVLRDKYGRKITREEFDRREAYRKKLEGMSAEEKKKARKKEMERREKWRNSLGKQLFGESSKTIIRNLDLKEGVSSREVNKLMREAYGKQGNRAAARKARKQFARAS